MNQVSLTSNMPRKAKTNLWFYLLNEEFYGLFKPLVIVYAFNTFGQLILIEWASHDHAMLRDRYESFYSSTGCILLFMISLALITGLFILHFYSHYWGSKSIYTLMTLPLNRSGIYIVLFSVYTFGLVLFLILEIITVFLGYGIFLSRQASLESGRYVMKNGLFLAFVRSDFLRILVPLTLKSFFSNASLTILLPITVLYGVISERSMRYANFIPAAIALLLMILTVSQRMNNHSDNLLIMSSAMILLSCYFAWQSLRIIHKNGISG